MRLTTSLFCEPVNQAYRALLRVNMMGVTDIAYYPTAGFEAGFVYEGDPKALKIPTGYKLREYAGDLYLCKTSLFGILYTPLFFIKDCRGWDWETANDPGM